jgi:hypothetical protein
VAPQTHVLEDLIVTPLLDLELVEMSDDSSPRSPIVDYLTREADQKTVHRAFESLEKSLSQIAESGEQEQLQMLRDRLDQVDSRLDDFDERLKSLESAIDQQNDLLSELSETVGTVEKEASEGNQADSSAPIVDDNGAMILRDDISAHYLLRMKVGGRDFNINIELDNGSGHATIAPDKDQSGSEHRIHVDDSGQFEFESDYPSTLYGLVTYRFQSRSLKVSIAYHKFNRTKSYQIVSAEPK